MARALIGNRKQKDVPHRGSGSVVRPSVRNPPETRELVMNYLLARASRARNAYAIPAPVTHPITSATNISRGAEFLNGESGTTAESSTDIGVCVESRMCATYPRAIALSVCAARSGSMSVRLRLRKLVRVVRVALNRDAQ